MPTTNPKFIAKKNSLNPSKLNYVITQFREANGKLNRTIEAKWGSWTDPNALILQKSGVGDQLKGPVKTLSFKMTTYNYFAPMAANKGHLSCGIGARHQVTSEALGRGTIFGNATLYPNNSGICAKTSIPNCAVSEVFWSGGNCVMGSSMQSPAIFDEKTYDFQLAVITTPAQRLFGYSLKDGPNLLFNKYTTDNYWSTINNADYNGWWFAEVLSDHEWAVILEDVIVN